MNRLERETSPYLRQHAENPVDWYPWGEEAFARAREENKPILLSIGYAACHWCHVMERESFSNPEIAQIMNEHYVCIKVDREERPDVDAVYMEAVVAFSGTGGWPLTVFLTPEAEPFFGGTYYPASSQVGGPPAFPDLIEFIAEAWKDKRDDIQKTADQLLHGMRERAKLQPADLELKDQLFYDAVEQLMMEFDWGRGGTKGAPKFPYALPAEYALRRGAWQIAEESLDAMAQGGMYDLVGGGFHRYSTDEQWLIPHFEKMLYDNALLAVCYLHAWQALGTERYREVAVETVEYMLRELAVEGGGFASSQDADTNGVEGLTYTWTRDDGIPDEMLHHCSGNRFVLRGELDPELRARLFEERAKRPQPGRDDKVVTAWNGLVLAALAECGRALDRPDWVEEARKLGAFLLESLSTPDGRLHRTFNDGEARGEGFLEDYADLAHGLYELHVSTGELRWLEEANRLARLAVELFHDEENGGFFQTPKDGEELIVRHKSFDDHPEPSGNSMIAYVLLRLSRIYGDDELEQHAVGCMQLVSRMFGPAAGLLSWMLVALDLYLAPRRELAVVGPVDSEIARAVISRWDPRAVIAHGPAEGVPLLEGKTLVGGQPAVYVCERFACQAPIVDPSELEPVVIEPPERDPSEWQTAHEGEAEMLSNLTSAEGDETGEPGDDA